MNIILILLKFLFLSINTNILCEKIKLKSFKVKSNHLIYFNNFIFNNYSSENPIKQGLNYSLKFSPSKTLQQRLMRNEANNGFEQTVAVHTRFA